MRSSERGRYRQKTRLVKAKKLTLPTQPRNRQSRAVTQSSCSLVGRLVPKSANLELANAASLENWPTVRLPTRDKSAYE